MRWSNGDFHLDLSVVGYEFPEETNCAEDSDWLLVQLRIECPAGPWTHIDPSLTVREVRWLAEWLREAARYGAVFSEWQRGFEPLTTTITFTEPNLAFELRSVPDAALPFQFRVYMSAESMPPFDLNTPHFEMGVVGWNYARQETPRGRDSHARSVQTRSVNPIAIAGVRWRYC